MNPSNAPRNPPGSRERFLIRCKSRAESGMHLFFSPGARCGARCYQRRLNSYFCDLWMCSP